MADLRPVYVAGDGDVKGPASASNNFLPLFADTTGKLLKSSGTGVTTQGLAILDDNTPAEQRNTIGLDQVNNTSDVNKPVSTAQQAALKLKQDKLNYTPVQQGYGIGQTTSKIYIGFGTGRLKATVDKKDLGNVVFDGNTATESVVGVAKIATGVQVNAGLDDTSIVTPKKMKAAAYIIEKITGENCQQAGLTAGGTLPYMRRLSDKEVIFLATHGYVDKGLLTKIKGDNCIEAGLTAGGTLPYMKKTDGKVIHLSTREYVDNSLLPKITGEKCTEAGFTAGGTLPYMKKTGGEVVALAVRTNTVLEGSTNVPNVAAGSSDERIANTRFVTTAIAANPAIGVKQAWQDMTASRAKGVTYTNNTGRPIQIFINFDPDGGKSVLKIAGHNFNVTDNSSEFVSAIIPAGTTYSLSAWGLASTMKWLELR